MKLLVIAYPRSGTRYTRTALTSLGLRVGHETVEGVGIELEELTKFYGYEVRDEDS